MNTITETKTKLRISPSPLVTSKERALIWEKMRGVWKNRKPDPIKELSKIRKEWDRRLPK